MSFPDFNALRHPATYGVVFTIATVASLETLLNIEAVDNLDPHKHHTPPNRELLAQGIGSQQWRLGWAQFGPFIITIVAVLFTDLLKGVSIGLVLGFFFILKDNAKAGSYLRRDEATGTGDGDLRHLRLPEHVSFFNKASIVTTLDQLPAGSRGLLDGSRSDVIDQDVLDAIEAFRQAAPARGITLELRGIRAVALGGH